MVPVKLIMTPVEKLKSVDRGDPIRRSSKLMRDFRIGSLLVTNQEAIVGIVTDTDLARRAMAEGLDPDRTPVERIMSAPVVQIDVEATLLDASDLMAKEGVRHLGVQKEGKLIGIVSVRDLVNFLTKYPRS
jgi:CBS domain-containing protein